MKFKLIIILLALLSTGVISAQEKGAENKERKVELFSSEERDNLQFWINDEIDKLGLSPKMRDEYVSVMLYYVVKISRLDDNDKGYEKSEILERFEILINKMHAEMKILLNADQYNQHLEIFKELTRSYKNRLNKL